MIGMICATIPEPEDREYMLWVYQEYQRLMFFTVKKYISNPADQEDIVQDSLERLIKKIPQMRTLDRFALTAYIVSTVRNTAINFLKRAKKSPVCTDQIDESGHTMSPDPIASLYHKYQLKAVWALVTEEERILLEGKYIIGYSDTELAGQLHCKASSVRMKLTRARRRAISLLDEQERDVTP